MSLRRDFHMYFEGCVIGIIRNGATLPFYVYSIESGDSVRDREQLRFRGEIITDAAGHVTEYTASYSELVFELPEIGWMKISGRKCWVTYQKRKTVKKGICQNRLEGLPASRFNRQAFWQFYNPSFQGRLNANFAIIDGNVMYKGYTIGSKSGNTLTLKTEASYLTARLGGLTTCQIQMEQ